MCRPSLTVAGFRVDSSEMNEESGHAVRHGRNADESASPAAGIGETAEQAGVSEGKAGFLCDVMLGRLARELRLLGMDVEYLRGVGGMQAYRQARGKGRILLTRSKRLAKLPGTKYLEAADLHGQVAEVRGEAVTGVGSQERPVTFQEGKQFSSPAPVRQAARCFACNEPLTRITREQARPSVPFFIYQIHHEFTRCARCKRVYWPGSHARNMQESRERRAQPRRPFAGREARSENAEQEGSGTKTGAGLAGPRRPRFRLGRRRPRAGKANAKCEERTSNA